MTKAKSERTGERKPEAGMGWRCSVGAVPREVRQETPGFRPEAGRYSKPARRGRVRPIPLNLITGYVRLSQPRSGHVSHFLEKKIVYFSASASRHAWLAPLRWKSTQIILAAKLIQDPAQYRPIPAKK